MNDEVDTNETPSELETLKHRADMMGIDYHPNIGVDKLKLKIANKLGGQGVEEDDELPVKRTGKAKFMTHEEFLPETTIQRKKDVNKLVRVRITCMNPQKSNYDGEIFSVGSAKMGTYKKYIPYNAEDGWHIPHIMYEALKERKYSHFINVKGPRGEKIRKAKLVPEFSIEVLPPLNPKELKALAQRQAMAAGSDD